MEAVEGESPQWCCHNTAGLDEGAGSTGWPHAVPTVLARMVEAVSGDAKTLTDSDMWTAWQIARCRDTTCKID